MGTIAMKSSTIELESSTQKLIVVSDLHAYMEPLNALEGYLAQVAEPYRVLVNGDLFEGGIDAAETVEWVRSHAPDLTTRGNHDSDIFRYVRNEISQEPPDRLKPDTELGGYAKLNEQQSQFILDLPDILLVHWRGKTIRVVHGHHNFINADYTPWTSAPDHLMKLFCDASVDLTLIAHTHFPFVLECNCSLLANSGSLALPIYRFRNAEGEIEDRSPGAEVQTNHTGRCSFLSITENAGQLDVQIVRFDHDRDAMVQRYEALNDLKYSFPFRRALLVESLYDYSLL